MRIVRGAVIAVCTAWTAGAFGAEPTLREASWFWGHEPGQVVPEAKPVLDRVDTVMFWTWNASNLVQLAKEWLDRNGDVRFGSAEIKLSEIKQR